LTTSRAKRIIKLITLGFTIDVGKIVERSIDIREIDGNSTIRRNLMIGDKVYFICDVCLTADVGCYWINLSHFKLGSW
jgi:hypothetical protein